MKFKLNESIIPSAREVIDEHFSWAQEELGDASPEEYVQFFKDIASEAGIELEEDDLIDAVLDYFEGNVTEPLPEDLEDNIDPNQISIFDNPKNESEGFVIALDDGSAAYISSKNGRYRLVGDIRGARIFKTYEEAQELIDDVLSADYDLEVRPYAANKYTRDDFIKVLLKYNFTKLTPQGQSWERRSGNNWIKAKFGTPPSYAATPALRATAYSVRYGEYPEELYHSPIQLEKFIKGFLHDIGLKESSSHKHIEEASSGTTVYRAEYYEPKLDKWISYYESSSLDSVKSNLNNPIVGNPKKRIAEYQKSGVRKPSYKFVKNVPTTQGINSLEESSFKSGDRYYGGLPSEPSASEYGKAISAANAYQQSLIDRYGIKVIRSSGQIVYTGNIDGHEFTLVENTDGINHYVSALSIDGADVDIYKSPARPDSIGFGYMFEVNASGISAVIDFIEKDALDELIYRNNKSLEEDNMKFKVMNEDYYPGMYGDRIFELLDKMSGDQIHACLIDSGYNTVLGTTTDMSMSEVYDKVQDFLDKDSGAGLYKELDRYCYWNKICESAKEEKICCICKQLYQGYGNNPYPVKKTGRCCDRCNIERVVPMRFKMMKESKELNEADAIYRPAGYVGKPGLYYTVQASGRGGRFVGKTPGEGKQISIDNAKWIRNNFDLEKISEEQTEFGRVEIYKIIERLESKKLDEAADDGVESDWEYIQSDETKDDENTWQPLTLWKNQKTGEFRIIIGDYNPWDGYSNFESFDEQEALDEFDSYFDDPYYNESLDVAKELNEAELSNSEKLYNKLGIGKDSKQISIFDDEEFAADHPTQRNSKSKLPPEPVVDKTLNTQKLSQKHPELRSSTNKIKPGESAWDLLVKAYPELADTKETESTWDLLVKAHPELAESKELNEEVEEVITEKLSDGTYKITYYLSTATRDRRPETREDIDNDYKEIIIDANDDFDALSQAFMIQRGIDDSDITFELDEYDINTEDDFIKYFDDIDWSDGSILMLKVEGPNGVLYDTGCNKQTFLGELEDNIAYDKAILADMEKEDPEMAKRFRDLLGIDDTVEVDDESKNNTGGVSRGHVNESLDQEAVETEFARMKTWLLENEKTIDGREFAYDGPYVDLVDTCYSEAYNDLMEDYNEFSIEASIQNGVGSLELFMETDEGTLYNSWDYESDCENLLDIAKESDSAEEFISGIKTYITGFIEDSYFRDEDTKYDDEELDDEYDEEEIEEALNNDSQIKRFRHMYGVED